MGKLCFRSDSRQEVELSASSEKQVVAVDREPLPSESPRRPSPELDIVAACVGEIGMCDHRESYRDWWPL